MAATRLLEFIWPVHESGYVWGDAAAGSYCPEDEGWYRRLVPVDPHGPVRRYEPLRQHGALFRAFADIDPGLEGEGIVRFANKFGLLGRPPAGYRIEVPGLQVSDGFLDTWDLYRVWWQAILAMRDLVHLWDLVHARDLARLQQHVRWEGDDRVTYNSRTDLPRSAYRIPWGEGTATVIASRQTREHWLDQFTPGEPVTPALFHLMASVNAWLRGLADPRLDWEERPRRLVTRVVPNSLLGGLWLQFHQAIAGQKNYRQCEVCNGWFEISPRVNRSTKLYCGDACRSQAYRDRQKRAQQLHDEGKSIKRIAEAVGSDVRTVKTWVRNMKE